MNEGADRGMPRFGQMLKSLVDASGVSISRIAQATGIDRPTIHKYISGSRMPSEDKLMRLLAVLKTTAGEQKQLRMQYELENTGELTFYQRMAVKQMLENLQLTEQYDTQIALPEIRAEMRQADQTVQILKGRPSIAQAVIALAGGMNEGLRLFPGFPAHLMHMAAAAIARKTAPAVRIQQLLCYPKQIESQQDVRQCIAALAEAIPLSLSETIQYEVYYYYENAVYHPDSAILFPYCALFDDVVVMVSDDLEQLAILRDPAVAAAYRERFDRLLHGSRPLVTKGRETIRQICDFAAMEEQAAHNYRLLIQPCLPRYASSRIIKRVLSGMQALEPAAMQRLLERVDLLRATQDDFMFFTEEGVARFAREGYVADLPKEWCSTVEPEERIAILSRLREDCMANYRRMLRPDTLRMPANAMLEICEDNGVVLVVSGESFHHVIVVKEDGIVKAMCDFVEHLMHSDGVASREETIAMIDQYICELEAQCTR